VARGRGIPEGCAELAVIAVDDPRRALGELARAVRNEFTGPVIGVTGSNGKTTTKELIAAALRPLGSALRTPGNRNTDVGLPLTILSATGNEATWVLEMAMRARGEIAELARIGRPDIGVVTNVAAAHLETLGSIEEVARAKGEIFGGLGPNGIAIFPADDPLIVAEAQVVPAERRLTFGSIQPSASPPATTFSLDVRVLELVPAGAAGSVVRYAVQDVPVVVRLPLGGAHNARNGAAALAVALAAGVPAVAAAGELERVELPPHRSAAIAVGGRTILDDAYNANPGSMAAAIAAVAAAAGGEDGAGSDTAPRALAILGDMLELGPDAAAYHEAIGREAGARLGGVVAVGAHAGAMVAGARAAGLTPERAVTAASPEEAARIAADWTAPGDWILVKASRGLRLERAVETLRALLDSRPPPQPQPKR
jgi:UDP-N-acetylmuramoyl-tripeptide--D-alanyl-D-alanine ligase